MKRVNLYEIYRIGWVIHRVSDVKSGMPVSSFKYRLFGVKHWLEYLLNEKLVPLVTTRESARKLIEVLDAVFHEIDSEEQKKNEDGKPVLDEQQAWDLKHTLETFETILAAELETSDTYFVSQKLGYDTLVLIERADRLLPDSIREKVPAEARLDLQQAGRCIAFDIPTAAGFHIVRATESVIRLYYANIVGSVPKPKMRNWGVYIKGLNNSGADKRIIAVLEHIREFHRNPVFHPEETLSTDEAHVLSGVAVSSIVKMMTEIIRIKEASAASEQVSESDIPF